MLRARCPLPTTSWSTTTQGWSLTSCRRSATSWRTCTTTGQAQWGCPRRASMPTSLPIRWSSNINCGWASHLCDSQVGEHIQKEPSDQLNDRLFYLWKVLSPWSLQYVLNGVNNYRTKGQYAVSSNRQSEKIDASCFPSCSSQICHLFLQCLYKFSQHSGKLARIIFRAMLFLVISLELAPVMQNIVEEVVSKFTLFPWNICWKYRKPTSISLPI